MALVGSWLVLVKAWPAATHTLLSCPGIVCAHQAPAQTPARHSTPPGDLLGRGLEIMVPGSLTGQAPQKHSFAFDKVFQPTASQESVFEEISELVQSALDGHKVRGRAVHHTTHYTTPAKSSRPAATAARM